MDLLTAKQIAEQLRERLPRIRYIITYYEIKEVQRIGMIRLFNPATVQVIKEYCYNMRIQKGR